MNFRFQLGSLKVKIGEPAPLRILFVRHSQSQTYLDKTLHGAIADPDIKLTDLGKEQAREAGAFLAGAFLNGWLRSRKWKRFRLYRSDYRRAVQTSDIIIDQLAVDLNFNTRMDERIRRLEFGYPDAVSAEEIRNSF